MAIAPTINLYSTMVKPNVFISHRESDKQIADVINNHLQEWGVHEDAIFQSSDPKSGLTVGASVHTELKARLQKVNLLILLYTYSDVDWSYCMWECGIAQGKSTVPTRIVVFQCTQDEPTVYKNQVRVKVAPRGIQSFTKDFHKLPGFIPINGEEGKGEAFASRTPNNVILARSERLYESLTSTIPSGVPSSKHLWDFIRLRLAPEHVKKIQLLDDREKIMGIIKNNMELLEPVYIGIGYNVDTAVRQFGYAGYQPGLKMYDLVRRWTEMDKTGATEWIDDLYNALYRAVKNTPAKAVLNPFKSVREDTNWWFFIAITRMRGFRDHSLEFDIYLIRAPWSKQPLE